jgi:hypothetical protein
MTFDLCAMAQIVCRLAGERGRAATRSRLRAGCGTVRTDAASSKAASTIPGEL